MIFRKEIHEPRHNNPRSVSQTQVIQYVTCHNYQWEGNIGKGKG